MNKARKPMQAQKAPKNAKKLDIKQFVHKTPKGKVMKREKNQYQFVGFFERLKALDMKQAHSMEMRFDGLLDTSDQAVMEDQLQSNFIYYLRAEKLNNQTLDFKTVVKDIEPLCFSQALIVLNKTEIVAKLMGYLKADTEAVGAQATSDTVIKGKVLELLIALIKDLRGDIYDDFKRLIMPQVISIIDVQNIGVMESIFTLFSYSFKYLLKSIRADIKCFYDVFQEVLVHKNRHLRHFASQCFSYVLKKMTLDGEAVEMILQPLMESTAGPFAIVHVLQGVSDVLLEVMYGASEDLHSKATEVLSVLLTLDVKGEKRERLDKVVRYLLIKLVNSIDTAKQLPLFECIHRCLLVDEMSEAKLTLCLLIFQDTLRLKLGRRVSHVLVIQMIESLNFVMTKKQAEVVQGYSTAETLELLASTVSYLYYFKHASVLQVFQGLSKNIEKSKSIFTHYVYKCCSG